MFCHLLKLEESEGKRLLYSKRSFTLFMPFFVMWPYETHIYTNRHASGLSDLTDDEIVDLADIIKVAVAMYNSLFDFDLPYIMAVHQAPCKDNNQLYHLHIEFYPIHRSKDKLKYAAGIEWGAGAFTYDDLPEEKVNELKTALKKATDRLSSNGYLTKGKSAYSS